MSDGNLVKNLAGLFINSKLTPVIILFSIFLGIMAVVLLPREEEPQIIVPMADVFVDMPGATPEEVTERVIKPMEKVMQEVQGVEYIYSTASPGRAMMVVRFLVGNNMEDSLVKLYNKLYSNFDKIPPGVSKPLIKPRTIDDVPIISFTLWNDKYDGYSLRQLATQLNESIKQTQDVAETNIIGGYRKYANINLIPSAMAAYNVDPSTLTDIIQKNNAASYLSNITQSNNEILLKADGSLKNIDEVGQIVISTNNNKPVYLRDVAKIELGPENINNYVLYKEKGQNESNAVTITVSKKKGSNATVVANNLINKLKIIRKDFIPSEVNISITRNYGETAAERSNELLVHMFIAIVSVSALIWFALGRKESLIVALAIPTTLSLTLASFVFYGFSLNRVTFFALIFSIGILVDDAIVVVENVIRHLKMPENKGKNIIEITLNATNEVGNPTILATITVISAILPMAFVGGLMGPYMRPIPIGASTAMIISMLVAFIVIPWATVRILSNKYSKHNKETKDGFLTQNYRKIMNLLLHNKKIRKVFIASVILLLGLSFSLVFLKLVIIKMLPFDNKSEFQIIIDTKVGSSLEQTTSVAQEVADYLITLDEVTNYQIYAGISAPYNFNGLVRHYYLRKSPNQADIQVNLKPKAERMFLQSHDIAKKIRPNIEKIAFKNNAKIKIVEIPPGPPVLQTLVAEIYGPDYTRQVEIAKEIMNIFKSTPSVVDVDWYMEDPHDMYHSLIDHEKSTRAGITADKIVDSMEIAFKGKNIGLLHDQKSREDVPIWLQFPYYLRTSLDDVKSLHLINSAGQPVSIQSLIKTVMVQAPNSIYHKNLKPVVYVTADVSGTQESPVYTIMNLYEKIDNLKLQENYKLKQYLTDQPMLDNTYSMKWDGEWQITYEVFRDLGIAFAVVMILIYALMVGWFQSFRTPLIIMSAIPFSLVGILPAHMLMGAFFTATSMIGFIAGAGIVVRNSIILVDFIELRVKEGLNLSDAVVEAGAVRFKPMMLTAMAVVVGSAVILFDPIFQGLAISLMAGEIASLFLSRTTVPVLYYMVNIKKHLNNQIIPVDNSVSFENTLTNGST